MRNSQSQLKFDGTCRLAASGWLRLACGQGLDILAGFHAQAAASRRSAATVASACL